MISPKIKKFSVEQPKSLTDWKSFLMGEKIFAEVTDGLKKKEKRVTDWRTVRAPPPL